MATRTLALPSWMNVVLEGGGLELERAAVDYARLSSLLQSDWKPRARELTRLITDVTTREFAVLEAEERARKRAAHDAQFTDSLELTRTVQKRRATLATQLGVPETDLCKALDRVREEADEASQLVRAWEQFGLERTAWSLVLAGSAAAAPLASYLVAKEQGGVRFDLAGILDSTPSVLTLFSAVAIGTIARARLVSWQWLLSPNGREPSWTPTVVVFGTLLACLPLTQLLPGVAGAIALAASAWQLGGTLISWRRR